MTIYEIIKQQKLQALKDRDQNKRAALSVIQGELERVDKAPSDEKTLKILKGVEAAWRKEYGSTYEVDLLASILKEHTPEQLTEAAIREMISNMSNIYGTPITLGDIQKFFKTSFPGRYDAALVTRIFKEG